MSYSVIISTYNRFDYLQDAIKSALNQTLKPLEIIVINDGSTDKRYSEDWHKKYGDIVVRIDFPENSRKTFGYPNPGYVRNTGIKQAKGDYIAIIDDDDVWFPFKMERQLNEMKRQNIHISSTNGFVAHSRWQKEIYLDYSIKENMNAYPKFFNNPLPSRFTEDVLKSTNYVVHSSSVFHKSLWEAAGGYSEYKSLCEDYNLFLKIVKITDILYIDEIMFIYDLSPNHRLW